MTKLLNYPIRSTIRLSEKTYAEIVVRASVMEIAPSALIRMLIERGLRGLRRDKKTKPN